MKANSFCFLQSIDGEKFAEDYWDKNLKNIYPFFLPENRDLPAVVCSASPEFLLKPVCEKLCVDKVIGTQMDPKTGYIKGKNCKNAEKAARISKELPDYSFYCAYSDSLKHDKPILELGERAFLAKKGKIKEIHINRI